MNYNNALIKKSVKGMNTIRGLKQRTDFGQRKVSRNGCRVPSDNSICGYQKLTVNSRVWINRTVMKYVYFSSSNFLSNSKT